MAINLHLLTDKGFTKTQLQSAQEYLLQNSKGLSFKNSFSNNREEQLFTTHNIVEHLMPYDPNKGPKAQIAME